MWIHQRIKEWLSHLCDMAIEGKIKISEKFIQKFKPVSSGSQAWKCNICFSIFILFNRAAKVLISYMSKPSFLTLLGSLTPWYLLALYSQVNQTWGLKIILY